MTAGCAWKMDSRKDPLAEFACGAGHIDPVKAVHPGLAYEISSDDYIKSFCSSGDETAALAKLLVQENITCPKGANTTVLPKDLNYPSMASQIRSTHDSKVLAFSEKLTRTVTNVGAGKSSPDYKITVKPEILTFQAVKEKRSFELIIDGNIGKVKMVSASVEWIDGLRFSYRTLINRKYFINENIYSSNDAVVRSVIV